MEKKRVLVVHNYYQIPGGEDTVVANEIQMLREHGHKVLLYSRNNNELKSFSLVKKILFPFMMMFNWKTFFDIRKIIKKEAISIVHVHNTLSLVSPAVYYAALSCHVPAVQTVHNFRLVCPGATLYRDGRICEECGSCGLFHAIKNKCYRHSKIQTLACVCNLKLHRMLGIYNKISYICLTEFNKEKIKELSHIFETNKIYVKPNFINDTVNNKADRKEQFVFAARVDRLKGIDVLLKAWRLWGEEAPKLIVCGIGPDLEWCKSYIQENKLKNIELLGFVENEKCRKLISESKALVLPTKWYEGFPMNIVEAYSQGTPVITSDIGNTGGCVFEGVTGAKFRVNDEVELINAVKRLAEYPNIYETTKKEFEEKYTSEVNYNLLMKIYNEI